jgi:hypothetical protein
VFLDQLVKILPLDIFHDEVMLAFELVDVVGVDNVGVIELRGGTRFDSEALQIGRVGHAILGEHFNRAAGSHQNMLTQIHATHAPLAEHPQEFVFAQDKATMLARKQLVGLPFGEDLGFDQSLS